MNEEKPLLSDFLEELKTYKEGVFLDKTISIFYNDWSLSPDFERVFIKTAKLKDIDTKKYKSYKVLDGYQNSLNPNLVKICVKRIKK